MFVTRSSSEHAKTYEGVSSGLNLYDYLRGMIMYVGNHVHLLLMHFTFCMHGPYRSEMSRAGIRQHIPSGRKSQSSWFNPNELPSVTERLARVSPSFSDRVGAQRVLRYGPGDFFGRHMDKWLHTPELREAYDEHGRCVNREVLQRVGILFCYLNDCMEGGATRFTEIPLPPIKPRQGLAVIHFPTSFPSLDLDYRTYHESLPAADEK